MVSSSETLAHNDRQIHTGVNGTKDVEGASSCEWPYGNRAARHLYVIDSWRASLRHRDLITVDP